MANISILGENLIGYDTGCGNVLMDMWISEIRDLPYDRDGLWAKMGNIDEKLLENMLKDDYFNLNYPKSTGREYFNKVFLIKYIEPYRDTLSPEDIEATLLALTVHSIANEIKKFDVEELLVSGGGADNLYLMEMLQRELPNIKVSKTERYGISSDNMEAMIFAWLAYKRLNRESISLKSVTGAKNNTILGGVYARS
jgi:anhydro-N-acetylmuramic acid kinase